MKTEIFSKDRLFLDVDITEKQKLFKFVGTKLNQQNVIEDVNQFVDDLNTREKLSTTGFENGVAIPHCQSSTVKEPTVTIIRTNKAISDYESLNPLNEVRLIFLISINSENKNNEHIKILSDLATKLLDTSLIDKLLSVNSESFLNVLLKEKKESTKTKEDQFDKKIVALTACATGIAHTFMSAEALEKMGHKLGYEVLVEKQGAGGITDKLAKEDIESAECVIFAHDVALKNLGRFNGKKFIDVKVAKPLHDPEGVINDALSSEKIFHTDEETIQEEEKSHKKEIMQAIMTGISYMIPVIVAGGLLMGIANLLALIFGGDAAVSDLSTNISVVDGSVIYSTHYFYVFLAYINKFGWLVMQFLYPIFAAYVAYSIADRNGLLPGFLAGFLAAGLGNSLMGFPQIFSSIMYPFTDTWLIPAVPSGFIGALILGIFAGYLTKWISKVHFSQNLQPVRTMLFIPGVSVLCVVLLNFFLVEPLFGTLNYALQQFILQHQSSEYIYGGVVAAATAFDLGGPINKAAGTVAIGLAADGTLPLTARVLAIVIPPLGLGVATIIDKFVVGRKVFDKEEQLVGSTSVFLGFMAISEGAIPFMLKRPGIVIPINIIGAVVGSLTAIYLGAVQWLPLPAVWGWPLVDGIWAYMAGLAVGVLIVAFLNIFVRFYLLKKNGGH